MLALTVDFLQQSHSLKLDFSARDGIQLLRYALKRLAQDPSHPISQDKVWREALLACLGEDALDLQALTERRSRSLRNDGLPQGLATSLWIQMIRCIQTKTRIEVLESE